MIPDPVPAPPREPPFDDWASDLASSRENFGFDNYCAMIEEALKKAYRAGAVGGAAVPPPLASLVVQWREAATHSAHEAALADDPDGTYAARHRARAKVILECIFDLERAVVRARPGRRPEEEEQR